MAIADDVGVNDDAVIIGSEGFVIIVDVDNDGEINEENDSLFVGIMTGKADCIDDDGDANGGLIDGNCDESNGDDVDDDGDGDDVSDVDIETNEVANPTSCVDNRGAVTSVDAMIDDNGNGDADASVDGIDIGIGETYIGLPL
jgi:hypothetical protein